jgi:hypothetical protein
MSFNVLVTITGSTSLGPFQIAECTGYSVTGCTGCTDITNPSGVDITVNELTNGHYVNVTNDNTVSIQLTSSGTCDNIICLLIDGKPTLPPTNTPTSTPIPPTSTPTSTPIPPTNTPTPTSTPTSTPTPTSTVESIYITAIIIASTDSSPNGANCDEPNTGLIENYVWVVYNTNWFTLEGGYNVVKSSVSLTDIEIIDIGTSGYVTHPNTITTDSSTILRSSPDGSYMIADESTQGSGKLLFVKDGVYGTTTKCMPPTPTPTNTPTPTSTPIGCYEYTLGTSASSAQYYSFIDCDGLPGDGYIGGVGGYDATTVCAQTGQISAGGEIQVSTVGPCSVEPTPTPTNTPSITPTPTVGSGSVFISNYDGSGGNIYNVQVDNVDIFVVAPGFPVTGNGSLTGSYGGGTSTSTVGVFVNVATDAPVTLTLLGISTECITTPGYVEFTNLDLSTSPTISITMDQQGTPCN